MNSLDLTLVFKNDLTPKHLGVLEFFCKKRERAIYAFSNPVAGPPWLR